MNSTGHAPPIRSPVLEHSTCLFSGEPNLHRLSSPKRFSLMGLETGNYTRKTASWRSRGLPRMSGCVTPRCGDAKDELCLMVVKYGTAPSATLGRVNGAFPIVRWCFQGGTIQRGLVASARGNRRDIDRTTFRVNSNGIRDERIETKQPLAAPLIMQFIAGYGIMAVLQTSQVMLVDLYPSKSASMSANNNLIRCLISAAGTAAIDPMTNALGIGWSLVIFTGFAALLSPFMVLEYYRGMQWRQERAERDRRRENSAQQDPKQDGPIDVERQALNLEREDKERLDS
ncbi:hypothetical protein DL93DRAFT_2101057 [Clavulina sp. PMI_390]|nr:hypothetical protein DL93DRAFT_2101057 [Clavulina sp. PMI_390]